MAQEARRFIIHITSDDSGLDEENENESSAISSINNFRKAISNPGQYAKSRMMDLSSKMYKSESSGVSAAGVALNIGTQAVSATASAALNAAEYGFDRYCTLQEDYMSQQAAQNIRNTVNKAKGLIGSMFSGAAAGSSAGPWGAVAGAVIGAASYGVEQYYSYQSRMSGYYQKLNSTNFETSFGASRLGLTNNSRGTEN